MRNTNIKIDGASGSLAKKTRKFARSIPEWIQLHPQWKIVKAGPRQLLSIIVSQCDRPDSNGNLSGAWTGEHMREGVGCSNGTFWRYYKLLESLGFIVTLARGGACGPLILGNTVGVPGKEGALDHLRVERRVTPNGKGGKKPSKFDESSLQILDTGKVSGNICAQAQTNVSEVPSLLKTIHCPSQNQYTAPPKNDTLPVLNLETINPLQLCGNPKTTLSCSAANKLQPLASLVGVIDEESSAGEEEADADSAKQYAEVESRQNAADERLKELGIITSVRTGLIEQHPDISVDAINRAIRTKKSPRDVGPGFYVKLLRENLQKSIIAEANATAAEIRSHAIREKFDEHIAVAIKRFIDDESKYLSCVIPKYCNDFGNVIVTMAKKLGIDLNKADMHFNAVDRVDPRAVAVWNHDLQIEENERLEKEKARLTGLNERQRIEDEKRKKNKEAADLAEKNHREVQKQRRESDAAKKREDLDRRIADVADDDEEWNGWKEEYAKCFPEEYALMKPYPDQLKLDEAVLAFVKRDYAINCLSLTPNESQEAA